MEPIASLLKQGCKLYACFEGGRYVVRLHHPEVRTFAVLQENESLLFALQQAAKQLQEFDESRFVTQKNPV